MKYFLAHREETVYVGTSTGMIYRFKRYGPGKDMSKFVVERLPSIPVAICMHSPHPTAWVFCKDGKVIKVEDGQVFNYAKFPCQLKTGIQYYDDHGLYTLYGISTENILFRIGPYHVPSGERALDCRSVASELELSSLSIIRTGYFHNITAGGVNGWVYFMWFNWSTSTCTYAADRYHVHEIKEIKEYALNITDTKQHYFIVSMDVVGYDVIREYERFPHFPYMKLVQPSTIHQSSVASVRCMEVLPGCMEVLVGGLGVFSHDLNIMI